MMKFIFGMQINIEVFYKLILSFWVCATRHAQSTRNKKFAYLCNISRKAWGGGGEVDFLPANKHETFNKLIVSLWICVVRHAQSTSSKCYYHFRCVWPGIPKLPKITSLLFLCNILRKN